LLLGSLLLLQAAALLLPGVLLFDGCGTGL
jgi:hypothetical protein